MKKIIYYSLSLLIISVVIQIVSNFVLKGMGFEMFWISFGISTLMALISFLLRKRKYTYKLIITSSIFVIIYIVSFIFIYLDLRSILGGFLIGYLISSIVLPLFIFNKEDNNLITLLGVSLVFTLAYFSQSCLNLLTVFYDKQLLFAILTSGFLLLSLILVSAIIILNLKTNKKANYSKRL